MADFAALLQAALRHGWSVGGPNLSVEIGIPTGQLLAKIAASVEERVVIAERTSEEPAADCAKASGSAGPS